MWSDRWGRCLVAEVLGKRAYTYPARVEVVSRSVAWLRDSRRWIETYSGSSHLTVLHDVRAPRLALSIGQRTAPEAARALAGQNQIDVVGTMSNSAHSTPGYAVIYRRPLDLGAPSTRIARIAVPQHALDYDCKVSPAQDRIAWAVTAETTKGHWRYELWVCSIDGSDLRPIGAIGGPADRNSLGTYKLSVQWLPSGRGLWFVWDDRLYTVPVPGRKAPNGDRPQPRRGARRHGT